MSIAHAIIRAATARGTHHYLALDALDHLTGPDASGWKDLFHKHAKIYLEGAKAPDDEFKDFQNHVLHPRDHYWGGAPDKAQAWYQNLVAALARADWPTAVWCAGVMSHYAVDPLMPFHTAQSEAENNIHRAAEWSISRSYDDLARLADDSFADMSVPLVNAPNWLALAICAGADRANSNYEKLIAHYDIHRGVVDPPSGLDDISRRVCAEMVAYARCMLAAILDQAAADAKASPPEVSLALEVTTAALSMPVAKWRKKSLDAQSRAVVEAMYDELTRTGTVETHLPEDERVVREVHQREVLDQRTQPEPAKIFPLKPKQEAAARLARSRDETGEAEETPGTGPAWPSAPVVHTITPRPAPAPARAAPLVEERPVISAGLRVVQPSAAHDAPIADRIATFKPRAATETGEGSNVRRLFLSGEHDVVDAPSIGPKMAERLYAVGVDTVEDLLKAHPIALAARLEHKHVDEQTVTDWQDQARLVCTVPGLRGTHAQLLVGAGYRSAEAMAAADVASLCADVLRFAASSEGARVLRDGAPPDIGRVNGWIESARAVKAA